ncbi:MAG TPA: zinc ribbon domain-containing protein [Eubacteriaceae bacterium]|jgi:putative FmdB family regulatory protein|nr:zinc ribbon domain-containing protein [Eubacteriaceae bacterium]
MPLYLYKCKDCGNEFEELTRAEDRDRDYTCPKCGRSNSIRLFTSFSTITKSTSVPPCASSCPSGGCGIN